MKRCTFDIRRVCHSGMLLPLIVCCSQMKCSECISGGCNMRIQRPHTKPLMKEFIMIASEVCSFRCWKWLTQNASQTEWKPCRILYHSVSISEVSCTCVCIFRNNGVAWHHELTALAPSEHILWHFIQVEHITYYVHISLPNAIYFLRNIINALKIMRICCICAVPLNSHNEFREKILIILIILSVFSKSLHLSERNLTTTHRQPITSVA